jgi:hypothetical protein
MTVQDTYWPLIVGIAYALLDITYLLKVRPWQFSLRSVLIEMTIIAVSLGLIFMLLRNHPITW